MPRANHIVDFIEFPASTVGQMEKSRHFFADVFDWKYTEWGNDYVDTKSSGINADKSHRPSKPLVVVYSKNLEAIKEKIIKSGGKITRDIFPFPGGRRFHFRDPAGNELAVWSDKE